MLVRGYTTEGNKGEEKWDNCNSIINKIYFLKKKQSNQQPDLDVAQVMKIPYRDK